MPRIQVIDDSESMLAYLEQVLQEARHRVLAAASGNEAVRILRRAFFHRVIPQIIATTGSP